MQAYPNNDYHDNRHNNPDQAPNNNFEMSDSESMMIMTGDNKDSFCCDENELRLGFIRKVFGILSAQLSFTALMVGLTKGLPGMNEAM